jgi:hypothetical protein
MFVTISRPTLLRMRNVSNKRCRENQNTNFMLNYYFFFFFYVNEIMWKNIVESQKTHITIWHMRIACWITKNTNAFRTCNNNLMFFPLQQWLHERISVLSYSYIPVLLSSFLYTFLPHVSTLLIFSPFLYLI